MITTLLYVFVVLCIVGILIWGLRQIPGLPPIVVTVVIVIVCVMLLLWALSWVQGGGMHLGRFP